MSLKNIKGDTSLHILFKSFLQRERIANMLLQSGIKPNDKNNLQWTPIHVACYYNQIKAI